MTTKIQETLNLQIPRSVIYEHGALRMIDQTVLPGQLTYIQTSDYREVIDAIKRLAVRGAPAIGIAGAYAVALAARELERTNEVSRIDALLRMANEIGNARPTAVNLPAAVAEQVEIICNHGESDFTTLIERLEEQAHKIAESDQRMCQSIGENGADLIKPNAKILTICNTGALATGGIGTALGVIYTAHGQGKAPKVFSCETRPLLQGSRLTVWELQQAGVDVTLIVDSAAGMLVKSGEIDIVITGADRIARNGDTANKIGTYTLAVLAHAHNVPFYIAAPESTFDPETESLDDSMIEQRKAEEVTHGFGNRTAPHNTKVFSPAFDITPKSLITGYITDTGIKSGGRK